MSDIVDAIAHIAFRFRSLGLDPPAVVLLKNHDQGMRLLAQLHQYTHFIVPLEGERGGKVIEHPDGTAWMESEVHGMKVRWPAKKFAKEEGGYVWF